MIKRHEFLYAGSTYYDLEYEYVNLYGICKSIDLYLCIYYQIYSGSPATLNEPAEPNQVFINFGKDITLIEREDGLYDNMRKDVWRHIHNNHTKIESACYQAFLQILN